jgi:carboxymethylenebutenolidase
MQWNQFQTDAYEGMIAETIVLKGYNGDVVNAYSARPLGDGPFGGIVLVHHLPGWDELYREFARRFAHHGYVVVCPNLYQRYGHGTPDDMAAKVRGEGGVSDDSVVGDCEAAMNYIKALPYSNGKVGIIGTCSGGRHSVLTASRVKGFAALVDCWGGAVVMAPDQLTPARPVAPIDLTKDLSCPILGLFGNDDQGPSPEQVNQHEAELKKQGKDYEFHRYDGAGHAFFYHDRPAYRQQQAMDGWSKIFDFFGKHLQGARERVAAGATA